MTHSNDGVVEEITCSTIEDKIAVFIRTHTFFAKHYNGDASHTTSARRAFERDIYDFARKHGLPRRQAKQQVVRARQFCGEVEYDSEYSALGNEVSDSMGTDFEIKFPTAAGQNEVQSRRPSPAPIPIKHHLHRLSPPIGGSSTYPKWKLHEEDYEGKAAPFLRRKRVRSKSEEQTSQDDQPIAGVNGSKGRQAKARLPRSSNADLDNVGSRWQGFQGEISDGKYAGHGRRPDPDEEPSVSRAPLTDDAERLGGESALGRSRLPDAHRAIRREAKKQRRNERRKEEKLAQSVSKGRQSSGQKESSLENNSAPIGDTEPPAAVDPTESKSQVQAHENFVRANELDLDEHAPSTKKSKRNRKSRRKSKDKHTALDAELRALNADVNQQQIENLDQGRLRGTSKAVTDDIKEAKAVQQRVQEDEKAGLREVEQSTGAEARQEHEKNQRSKEPALDQPGSRHKNSKKRNKPKASTGSPDFPSPMIQQA